MVGKYMDLLDAYKSLNEALSAAGIHSGTRLEMRYIDSERIEREGTFGKLDQRGVEVQNPGHDHDRRHQDVRRLERGGDVDAAGDLIAPGALLSQADGQKATLDEQLPPDVFDDSWDWDGDGTVTLLDMIAAQNAWGSMIATSSEHQCAPDGSHVVCQVVQTDVFGDAAELDATEIRWAFRIADGLIVELVTEEESRSEADAAAWAEQFAAFEQWLADTDPEAYDVVFSAPCCSGSPETMRFTRASIDLQRELIPQWQTSLDTTSLHKGT